MSDWVVSSSDEIPNAVLKVTNSFPVGTIRELSEKVTVHLPFVGTGRWENAVLRLREKACSNMARSDNMLFPKAKSL